MNFKESLICRLLDLFSAILSVLHSHIHYFMWLLTLLLCSTKIGNYFFTLIFHMSTNSKNNNDFQVRHHWQLITPFKRSEVIPQHICQFSRLLNSWRYYFHWLIWPLWRIWAIGISSTKYLRVTSELVSWSMTLDAYIFDIITLRNSQSLKFSYDPLVKSHR